MEDARVEVLMSTYNGVRYLEEQIDSIINQSLNNIKITIRDDGSTDGTLDFLRRYNQVNNIEVREGENLGVVGSFFDLIYRIEDLSEFVAFSDQDDFWHERKLEAALRKLADVRPGRPAMYCSNTRLVDQNLKFIAIGGGLSRPVGLENSVLQNIATGCTIVLNREAVNLLRIGKPDLRKIRMHDWWIYQVLSAMGEVVFDSQPHIDYRQHDNNVVGVNSGVSFWANRLKRLFKRDKEEITSQLSEFLKVYNEYLSESQIGICRDFITRGASPDFLERIRYAVNTPLYRQSHVDDILFRILLILGYH